MSKKKDGAWFVSPERTTLVSSHYPSDTEASRAPSSFSPSLPADYYRKRAARVRQLADEATTAAIKEHLREVALQYEQLAARAENATRVGSTVP